MANVITEYEPIKDITVDPSPVTIISRTEWNAMPPKAIMYLAHPITMCHFGVENNAATCRTKEECMRSVKEIQNHWYDRGMEDLPYNFLVGNDGNVYEGRGWLYKPGPECSFRREYRDNTIQIGIIGGHKVATDETMQLVRSAWLMGKRLCNHGVQLKYISENYEIVGFKDDILDFNVEFKP